MDINSNSDLILSISNKMTFNRLSKVLTHFTYFLFPVGLLCFLMPVIGTIAMFSFYFVVVMFIFAITLITMGLIFASEGFKNWVFSFFEYDSDNFIEICQRFYSIYSPIITGLVFVLLTSSILIDIFTKQNARLYILIIKGVIALTSLILFIVSLSYKIVS